MVGKRRIAEQGNIIRSAPNRKKNIVSMLIVERAPASFHAEELQERRALEWE